MKRRERKLPGSLSPAESPRELEHRRIARRAAAEGMVLLKNEGVLPLEKGCRVALYGGGARYTIKGGTGSGSVNNRSSVSIDEGLQNCGLTVTNTAWLDDYDHRYREAWEDWKEAIYANSVPGNFDSLYRAHATHPMPMPKGGAIQREEGTDTAIYVVSRVSGEGADRKAEEGDYYLSVTERQELEEITALYPQVIVILNIGGMIDLSFTQELPIQALVLMSQAGMEGGNALGDVLTGAVNPCGKLTDTWAKSYRDYPSSATFSHNNGNIIEEPYTEGIYVGYRYFDSFQVRPEYPFGYGLSYTTFSLMPGRVQLSGPMVQAAVTVTNTGKAAGREVIQLYVSCPSARWQKEYKRLVAFGKTALLQPGEHETLLLEFHLGLLKSYHSGRSSYYMEAGNYYLLAGTDAETGTPAACLTLGETLWLETLRPICPLQDALAEIQPDPENFRLLRRKLEESARSANLPSLAIDQAAAQLTVDSGSHAAHGSDFPEIPCANTPVGNLADRAAAATGSSDHPCANTPAGNPADRTAAANGSSDHPCANTPVGNPADRAAAANGSSEICGERSPAKDAGSRESRLSETVSALLKRLSPAQKAALVCGRPNSGSAEFIGNAAVSVPGAAGETTPILKEAFGVGSMVLADGPAGIRIWKRYQENPEDGSIYSLNAYENLENRIFGKETLQEGAVSHYQFCSAIPVGTLLAQTFDLALMEEVGEMIGREMKEFGVTLWLAPGMNIHRNPLCGRNFEYYSEDPLLSGMMAAALTKGVQKHPGIGTTIKHFACNNQEENRRGVSSILSERALREIYLKGFEIAVREAQPMAIMTSYNKINGVHTANSSDLCTEVARREWNFAGIIMTDWTTTNQGGGSSAAKCIQAGNDLIMPGMVSDIQEILDALSGEKDQQLAADALDQCAGRMLRVILSSDCYEEAMCWADDKPRCTLMRQAVQTGSAE